VNLIDGDRYGQAAVLPTLGSWQDDGLIGLQARKKAWNVFRAFVISLWVGLIIHTTHSTHAAHAAHATNRHIQSPDIFPWPFGDHGFRFDHKAGDAFSSRFSNLKHLSWNRSC
jgi:hypothetical protein